jgi:hypothetical protein
VHYFITGKNAPAFSVNYLRQISLNYYTIWCCQPYKSKKGWLKSHPFN